MVDPKLFQKMFGHKLAHSTNKAGAVQTLFDHAQGVARLAGDFADKFGMRKEAELAAWLHDFGKMLPKFQARLAGSDVRVDHAIVGAVAAQELGHLESAFAIAGHHGGIPDATGGKGESFRDRKRRMDGEAKALAAQVAQCLTGTLGPTLSLEDLDFNIRVLGSSVTDADCLDTEQHFQPHKTGLRKKDAPDWDQLLVKLDAHVAALGGASPIATARQKFYQGCRGKGSCPQGIVRCEAPTGIGKTFGTLAFALAHARKHGLHRVIYALPYISITEQNADAMRHALGNEAVLEHHSNLPEWPGIERHLAAENWSGFPVVVTTTVQLLESLFSNRPSKIRKLHNICNSIVILDEVQALPPGLLEATLSALDYLRRRCGVTVVFCSATQPGFDDARWGLGGALELAPGTMDDPLWDRVDIRYAGELDVPILAAQIKACHQCLAVVNTLDDARNLAMLVPGCLHLSSGMCPYHRRLVLAEVKRRLAANMPCVLVATQVVEAGCDISFPIGFRAEGPLDSIWQVAGRINRHGEIPRGRLNVVSLSGGGTPPGPYAVATSVARRFVRANRFDRSAQTEYFRALFGEAGCLDLDRRSIQELRANLMFAEVARLYRMIDEETFSVVVPYGEAETLLRRFEAKGSLDMADYRKIRPYMVNVRRSRFQRLNVVRRADLWFCPDYSDVFGL